jgi:hypothetical protein
MITASPRLGALLAGGAALVAFGLAAPVQAEPTGGANSGCGAYCPSGVGAPSGNGNGNGNAYGKPGAGTVGNADSKNPPGQAPDGSDSNNGYECDGNSGVGKTNPAHSGCGLPDYPDDPYGT